MRMINERVSQWSCGRYFFFWCGDEILLDVSNDTEAIEAGEKLLAELEAAERMSIFTEIVLSRLPAIEADEMPFVTKAIEDLEKKGWTPGEATSYLRWLEHVNPTIDEETALRNMKVVRERVSLRLGATA